MDHPEFEVIENDEEISIHFRRITPIYPATEGLSQRMFRSIVYRLLNEVPPAPGGLETLLPRALMNSDMTTAAAIRAIHFPNDWQQRHAAREHLVLQNFCDADPDCIAPDKCIDPRRRGTLRTRHIVRRIREVASVRTDGAQRKVIGEIRRDPGGCSPNESFATGGRWFRQKPWSR